MADSNVLKDEHYPIVGGESPVVAGFLSITWDFIIGSVKSLALYFRLDGSKPGSSALNCSCRMLSIVVNIGSLVDLSWSPPFDK